MQGFRDILRGCVLWGVTFSNTNSGYVFIGYAFISKCYVFIENLSHHSALVLNLGFPVHVPDRNPCRSFCGCRHAAALRIFPCSTCLIKHQKHVAIGPKSRHVLRIFFLRRRPCNPATATQQQRLLHARLLREQPRLHMDAISQSVPHSQGPKKLSIIRIFKLLYESEYFIRRSWDVNFFPTMTRGQH